jgi:glutaredoxin
MPKVIIYGSEACWNCTAVKTWLKLIAQVEFEERDALKYSAKIRGFGITSLPVIEIGTKMYPFTNYKDLMVILRKHRIPFKELDRTEKETTDGLQNLETEIKEAKSGKAES